jgi:hypothetical protein
MLTRRFQLGQLHLGLVHVLRDLGHILAMFNLESKKLHPMLLLKISNILSHNNFSLTCDFRLIIISKLLRNGVYSNITGRLLDQVLK